MDQVKLAEIARDAEKEKLSKSRKELENLRDHAKTIYKVFLVVWHTHLFNYGHVDGWLL